MRAHTRLRNFGIIAHIDAGKTTVSERMLFVAGQTHRIGETHDGASKLDHLQQERDRGITIGAAATSFTWDDHQLNLLDTPGHVDFTVEVERSLRVLDGAVAVFDAVAGVEPQSETVWRQADRHGVPRIVFINKMDREGAAPVDAVNAIEQRLGATCLITQMPIGLGPDFRGVVDLVTGTMWEWASGDPRDVAPQTELEPSLAGDVSTARQRLVEQLAELDSELLDAWSRGTVGPRQLSEAIRRVTLAGVAIPVLFGAALAGIGTQPLLDAVVAWLPNPEDDPNTDPSGPTSALAFKVQHATGGRVVWTRIYSGSLTKGQRLHNTTSQRSERVSRLVRLDAGRTTDLDVAEAGDIVAVIGLKHTTTGETIADPTHPVVLETMDFPEPVMSVVIEPASTTDQDRLGLALRRLCDEDPSLRVRTDPETGETLLDGMGELHLQVRVEDLRLNHGLNIAVGEPKVALRETITDRIANWRYRLSKQTGGPGMFAEVVIDVEPSDSMEPGVVDFDDATRGGVVPAAFAKAFAEGFADAMTSGPVAGHPVVGIRVELIDGAIHPNDSSEQSFRMAGAQVCREVLAAAGPILLEPIMAVTVTTPEEHLGAAMALIGAKRGRTTDLSEQSGELVITALVPLQELFGFVGELRSASQGRAAAVMRLHGHEPWSP